MSFEPILDEYGVDDISKYVGEVKRYNMKDIKKTKVCSKCMETKELKEFWTDKRMVDGKKNVCKKCTNIDRNIIREKGREIAVKQENIIVIDTCGLCGQERICVQTTNNSVCIQCINKKVKELSENI